MLQTRVLPHVAGRIRSSVRHTVNMGGYNSNRGIMSPASMGPTKVNMDNAKAELRMFSPEEKHWFCGGDRSVAMAATLLNQGKVIAVPTDTIYGLAVLASNRGAIKRLYDIKKRNDRKPLAICLSNVNDVSTWGVVDHLPPRLLEELLPAARARPYTIVLRRTPVLNPALNPGTDSVGIRVPVSKFVLSVTQIVGPLALTSANISNEPSSLHPDEFSALWPKLNGIFYSNVDSKRKLDKRRIGSTVVDLTRSGYYKIIRHGIGAKFIREKLKEAGLEKITDE